MTILELKHGREIFPTGAVAQEACRRLPSRWTLWVMASRSSVMIGFSQQAPLGNGRSHSPGTLILAFARAGDGQGAVRTLRRCAEDCSGRRFRFESLPSMAPGGEDRSQCGLLWHRHTSLAEGRLGKQEAGNQGESSWFQGWYGFILEWRWFSLRICHMYRWWVPGTCEWSDTFTDIYIYTYMYIYIHVCHTRLW